MTTAVATKEAEPATTCSCCGYALPEMRLVRLSCHQEVGVCFDCLDWLIRQRRSQRLRLFRMALPGWVPDLPRRGSA